MLSKAELVGFHGPNQQTYTFEERIFRCRQNAVSRASADQRHAFFHSGKQDLVQSFCCFYILLPDEVQDIHSLVSPLSVVAHIS